MSSNLVMTKRPSLSWLSIALALATGLALRCWFIAHDPRVAGDSLVYGNIATNWFTRGVYGFVEVAGATQPTLIRLPGYPLFLAACFRLFGLGHYTPVLYLQAAIDLISCLLVASLAGRLLGRSARIPALWLSALCPFTAAYTAAALTETLTLFTISLAFYALVRWQSAGAGWNRWLCIITLASSFSILLRPDQGLLAAALFPAMVWIARTVRPAPKQTILSKGLPILVASICTLLPLVPWTLRNERTFHVFQPLAPRFATDPGESIPFGFQRWYRTWAIDYASTEAVYWNYNGSPIQLTDLPSRAFDTLDQKARTAAILDDYNQDSNATPQLDTRLNNLAFERIRTHPLRSFVFLPAARLANMLLRPRIELLDGSLEWWRYREHPRETTIASLYGLLNVAYLTLAAAGLYRWRENGIESVSATTMLAFILMRAALLLTLDNSEPRYTLEFFPILFVFAAGCFARPTGSSPRSSNSA